MAGKLKRDPDVRDAYAWEEDVCAVWTNNPFILGSVGLGEASDAMVELCLWAIYRMFR